MADNVAGIVDPLAELIGRARDREDVAIIYANGNYGDFTAEPREIVAAALAGARPELVRPIAPEADSRILLKVRTTSTPTSARRCWR